MKHYTTSSLSKLVNSLVQHVVALEAQQAELNRRKVDEQQRADSCERVVEHFN